jgi:thioredoxin:protein disulfide reductase
MKIKHVILLVAILNLSGATALAQSSASVVKVSAATAKVKRGGSAPVTVTLTIDGGYHINSNRPSEEFLIATALKLEALQGVRLTPVVYPRAKLQKFSFSPKPISVFDGQVTLRFTARAVSVAAGSHTIRGKLTIQACNDEACLRPQTVDVSIPIEVQ